MVREIADIRRGHALRTRPRAPREMPALHDLRSRSILVVTAHPDDEVISSGILLKYVPRAGVICLTGGAPRREHYARNAGFDNRLDYADARIGEAAAALDLLGREISPSSNLGILDQEAAFNLVPLANYLQHRIRSGFDCVITHAYEGGHPDHDAAAFAVHAACALVARSGMTPPVIIEVPLYNAPDGRYAHQKFLTNPDAGPVVTFSLSPEEEVLKQSMFGCHASQILTDFHTKTENFRVAPRYHFLAPPHSGDVGFNQFNWPITGKIWRAQARQAMRELDLLEILA